MARSLLSKSAMRSTPRTSSTSAAPDCEDTALLPCLATGTPAPAATKALAVESIVGSKSVAAGADDIHRAVGGLDGDHPRAHGGDGADDFVQGLLADAKRHQETGDLGVGRVSRHDDVEGFARLFPGQRRAIGDDGDKGFQGGFRSIVRHWTASGFLDVASRKFLINA